MIKLSAVHTISKAFFVVNGCLGTLLCIGHCVQGYFNDQKVLSLNLRTTTELLNSMSMYVLGSCNTSVCSILIQSCQSYELKCTLCSEASPFCCALLHKHLHKLIISYCTVRGRCSVPQEQMDLSLLEHWFKSTLR